MDQLGDKESSEVQTMHIMQTMATTVTTVTNNKDNGTDLSPDDWFKQYLECHSLKRNLDDNSDCSRKRLRDNDDEDMYGGYYMNKPDEEEEEVYEEIDEETHKIMNITNLLTNFSMNFVPLPDWPDESPAPKKPEFPPKVGQSIHGYRFEQLLSATKRTAVFVGYKERKPDEELIIKIGFEMGFHSLQSEHKNYDKLKASRAVVKCFDYLWWKIIREDRSSIRWGIIALEKCGPSLADLMSRMPGQVIQPMETVFEIAVKMLDAIEALHEKGFIHGQLKPEHFVLENDLNPNCLKLVGLSGAKSFMKASTGQHVEEQFDRKLPKGDPNFHSIGYHNGVRRSRRDDMESLGYCLVFLVKGDLPWMVTNKELSSPPVIEQIGIRMQQTTLEDMCKGLPNNFVHYFKIIEKYSFADKPDYEELKNCFRLSPTQIPQ